MRVRVALLGAVLSGVIAMAAMLPAGAAAHVVASRTGASNVLQSEIHMAAHHNTLAHSAGCSGACILAEAIPEWGCTLEGTAVAAGVVILFPEASAAWAIIAGGAWTAGCQAYDRYFLSTNQVSGLQAYEQRNGVKNCFYTWPKSHKTWSIRCAGPWIA